KPSPYWPTAKCPEFWGSNRRPNSPGRIPCPSTAQEEPHEERLLPTARISNDREAACSTLPKCFLDPRQSQKRDSQSTPDNEWPDENRAIRRAPLARKQTRNCRAEICNKRASLPRDRGRKKAACSDCPK